MVDFATLRHEMVRFQLIARGIHDRRVLEAMGTVPREAFVPKRLAELAYEDSPLPIEEGQTISQPYIVAAMAEALELRPEDCVLEIGAGSGYAAAVLGRLAREVWTVERHAALAASARERLERLGDGNVHIVEGDGSLGWPERAPYDAIVVAAGGPDVPPALLAQLAPGGRLVVPVGADPREQELVRVRKREDGSTERENLGAVRFVPLVGAQGWTEEGKLPVLQEEPVILSGPPRVSSPRQVSELIRETAEPFDDIAGADLGPLLERIGDCHLVLLGEATHGTSEFYRMRARITRELIEKKSFNIVAVEADWPDAAQVDRYVRGRPALFSPAGNAANFSRFPTWMWRNRDVRDFVHWLRDHNAALAEPERQASFHGLDLYSLYASIHAVTRYLDQVDPEAARLARLRYGCLTPWQQDPALYGQAALMGRYETCEPGVVATLLAMLQKQMEYEQRDGEHFLDAVQNARVAANAERYYRLMYYGSRESWNLRDQHMFDTLETVLAFRGTSSKAVVWEHNSHVGNAAATEMGARGEFNVGQLAREHYGPAAFLLGFGTDRGTVAAATDWDEEMEIKTVRPAHPESYERLCHDSGVPAFFLPLREPHREDLRTELQSPRLERAIGVIYRPETELQSHYFQAVLPWQFDEYCWFDETRAVVPLAGEEVAGMPETYPFGL
jgi:protein-L-isoaspartate(D-aspartate) O-methyltransferase